MYLFVLCSGCMQPSNLSRVKWNIVLWHIMLHGISLLMVVKMGEGDKFFSLAFWLHTHTIHNHIPTRFFSILSKIYKRTEKNMFLNLCSYRLSPESREQSESRNILFPLPRSLHIQKCHVIRVMFCPFQNKSNTCTYFLPYYVIKLYTLNMYSTLYRRLLCIMAH